MLRDVLLGDGVALTPAGIRFANPRTVKEMKDVMLKPSESSEVVYEVFRDVLPTHSNALRVDLTVLRPGLLPDGEYARTHGHKHPEGPWGRPWPELYCVLSGNGTFLLHDDERAYLVEVKEGDVVGVPGEMVHILVNTGDKEMITCNYVSKLFKSDYEYLKKRGGPAIFITKEGIVYNKNYNVKEVRTCSPLPLSVDELVLSYSFKPPEEEWLVCEPYI
ncbi:MAG: cupin domain-containing protein [Crenarchaeota archaeon]|nr:cupin domain-containing protein [Thermoproteota archaeon]